MSRTPHLFRLSSVVAASAATLLALASCGQSAAESSSPAGEGSTGGEKTTLVVAAVPAEESTALTSQWGGIAKLLERETGAKVTIQQATDYAAIVEGQRAGKIDLAMYGPLSYVMAHDGGVPVEPIGALIDAKDEKPGYTSTAWVPAASEIADLKGFAGKKVCFVDKASTSGYLYPSAGLEADGIDPETGVTPVMAGGHDASLLATKSGQCDAGFAYDTMAAELVKKGQLKEGELKQVWTSEVIPGSPIAMNTTTIPADMQAKIKAAIVEKGNKDALVAAGDCSDAASCPLPEDSWGFAAATDADYASVRTVCDLTKSPACSGKQ
ncbi:phosphonate transport system substrate-binding protein [Kineosphaera limosa]|uniref:Phosphonate ABC transporter substrate-binding protein n=1 Tax=Kineosphaera limosa NBRC 100340 TaxID=1184609 RepID=K6WPQ7_9MICO|nr:phosphate/phosphite/phosphonate ABC transporter substrate-binding protein [Kineosphaera limosa]NYE02257.1 phosphonate transport system substrate-binding protein [Kineosphaera limosa]GAB94112.1 phosphonate ABC transporter substrate-binding protein [Kineosphaera limosa NBRC 100340]